MAVGPEIFTGGIGEARADFKQGVTNNAVAELRRRALSEENRTTKYPVNVDRTLTLHAVDLALAPNPSSSFSAEALAIYGLAFSGDMEDKTVYTTKHLGKVLGKTDLVIQGASGELRRAGFTRRVRGDWVKGVETVSGNTYVLDNIPDMKTLPEATETESDQLQSDQNHSEMSTPELLAHLHGALRAKVRKTGQKEVHHHLLLSRALNLLDEAEKRKTFETNGQPFQFSITNQPNEFFKRVYEGLMKGELQQGSRHTPTALLSLFPELAGRGNKGQIGILQEAGVVQLTEEGDYQLVATNIPKIPVETTSTTETSLDIYEDKPLDEFAEKIEAALDSGWESPIEIARATGLALSQVREYLLKQR